MLGNQCAEKAASSMGSTFGRARIKGTYIRRDTKYLIVPISVPYAESREFISLAPQAVGWKYPLLSDVSDNVTMLSITQKLVPGLYLISQPLLAEGSVAATHQLLR